MDLGEEKTAGIENTSAGGNAVSFPVSAPSTVHSSELPPPYTETSSREAYQLDLPAPLECGTRGFELHSAPKLCKDIYEQSLNGDILHGVPAGSLETPYILPEESISRHIMPNSLPTNRRLVRSQPRLARWRDKALTSRFQSKEQRRRCTQQRRHCHGLQRQLTEKLRSALDTIRKSKDPGELTETVRGLEELWSEVDVSMEELEAENGRTDAQEDDLSYTEYQFGQKQDNFFHYLEAALTGEDTGSESTESSSDSASEAPSNESVQVELHPLLQELYSKMGDRKIYRDRWTNFQIDLRQDLEARETLRGEGKEVNTDEEFYSTLLPEQTRIQIDLEKAREDVRRLRQLCVNEGIDIENIADEDDESIFDAHTEVFSAPIDLEPSLKPYTSDWYPPINSFLNTRESIRKWLSRVDAPVEEPTLEARTYEAVPKDRSWVKLERASGPPTEAPQDVTLAPQAPDPSQPTQGQCSRSAPSIGASLSTAYEYPPRGRARSSA